MARTIHPGTAVSAAIVAVIIMNRIQVNMIQTLTVASVITAVSAIAMVTVETVAIAEVVVTAEVVVIVVVAVIVAVVEVSEFRHQNKHSQISTTSVSIMGYFVCLLVDDLLFGVGFDDELYIHLNQINQQ